MMPMDRRLRVAAGNGAVEEVLSLIAGGTHIEENDAVSDGARAGIERFVCCWFCFETRPSSLRL